MSVAATRPLQPPMAGLPKPPRPRAMSVSKKMSPAASRALAHNTLRQDKLQRVSNQLRKSKPDGAFAPSWKYFECYVLGSLNKYAVCTLFIEKQELERADIIYSQSSSNLLGHLNTDYRGHQAVFDACVEKKTRIRQQHVELPGEAREGRRAVSPATLAWTRQAGIKSWCDGWWRMPSPFR